MSETQGKYTKMRGNQNALKYPVPADDSYTFRCHTTDKETWKSAAAQAEMTLSEWVISSLNDAANTKTN